MTTKKTTKKKSKQQKRFPDYLTPKQYKRIEALKRKAEEDVEKFELMLELHYCTVDEKDEYELYKPLRDFNESKKSFKMYKKVYSEDLNDHYIAVLEVPKTALRIAAEEEFDNFDNIKNYKVRVSKAKVLDIFEYDSDAGKSKRTRKVKIAVAGHDTDFVYEVGKTVIPRYNFNTCTYNQCASGIHGYLSLKAAEEH